MRPTAIDLFAGAGGMSLGFEQAGFDVVAAVEMDPVHAAVHHYNFPYVKTVPRSIVGLTGADIVAGTSAAKRGVAVVFGGPPCQGFSLMGQRALDDPRNQLVREFLRIVLELEPSYFVFENVKGLTVGKHRAFLHELVLAFERNGYTVRTPWQVLNACAYGVPQDRERLILLGARRGCPVPSYPPPVSSPPPRRRSSFLDLVLGPSCGDALSDLPDADLFPDLVDSDTVRVDLAHPASLYSRELRCLSDSSWHNGHIRSWDCTTMTSSMRTVHSEISRRRFASTAPGTIEPISRFYKLTADGVSNTLRAGTDSARGAFTSPRPIHYSHPRCITVREMARLHGYPDWFRFHVTKWHGGRQVGNSVPPPLARAIALQLVDLCGGSRLPEDVAHLPLGSPGLLAMSVSDAAAYWGVQSPIARRDRKSGATKRRQIDIEVATRTGNAAHG
ncbi:MAG: DNA (cytosine-5-)-methyltransferase [Myxococcales bacterium]